MAYGGESPSKKFARYRYWLDVQDALGMERFRRTKHLVLASREGGDISCLLGMGVPTTNIIAVDRDREAVQTVKRKFPHVPVFVGDVVEIARDHRRELGSAFLDFCSYVTPALIQTIGQVVAHGLTNDAVIGCGFMKGREKGSAAELVTDTRGHVQKVMSLMSSKPDWYVARMWVAEFPEDAKNSITENAAKWRASVGEMLTPKGDCASFMSAAMRQFMLIEELNGHCQSLRCAVNPFFSHHYMSTRDTSRGVPMFLLAMKVMRAPIGSPMKVFLQKVSRKQDFLVGLFDPQIEMNNDEIEEFALWLSVNTHGDSWGGIRLILNLDGEDWIRCARSILFNFYDQTRPPEAVLQEASDSSKTELQSSFEEIMKCICRSLEIEYRTWVAWKAHRTMGKYQDLKTLPFSDRPEEPDGSPVGWV